LFYTNVIELILITLKSKIKKRFQTLKWNLFFLLI
jgi:hypothetical protein